MKKTFLSALLVLSIVAVSAQTDTLAKKVYRNEIGVDISRFVKYFLNFGSQNAYHNPTYYFTYRRHFAASNVRFGIGGDLASFDEMLNSEKVTSFEINLRLGYERYRTIHTRWQLIYGVDFTHGFTYYNANFQKNGGYTYDVEEKTHKYGLSPFMGMCFKLSNRLRLSTEVSIFGDYSRTLKRQYYTPINNTYPPLPDDELYPTTIIVIDYGLPLLLFTYDF